MNSQWNGSEFETVERDDVMSLLVERISKLSETSKRILAMYYYENLQPNEIGACLGLTEHEVELIHAQAVRLLRANLFRDLKEQNKLSWIPLDTPVPQSHYPWLDG